MKPAMPQWVEIIQAHVKVLVVRDNQILKHAYYRKLMKIVTRFSLPQLHMTKCWSTLVVTIHCVGAQNRLPALDMTLNRILTTPTKLYAVNKIITCLNQTWCVKLLAVWYN